MRDAFSRFRRASYTGRAVLYVYVLPSTYRLMPKRYCFASRA